jgi:hypothetical protein
VLHVALALPAGARPSRSEQLRELLREVGQTYVQDMS